MNTTSSGCKILFAWPNVVSKEMFNFLPLGIGYLAANLPDRHQTLFFDGVLSGRDNEEIAVELDAFAPDLVAISIWSFNFGQSAALIRKIREHRPQCRIVVGGPEPSGRTDRIFESFPLADYALVGEGEAPLAVLADCIARKNETSKHLQNISGLVFRDNGEVVSIPPKYPLLDDIVRCDYEFIRFREYLVRGYSYGKHRKAKFTAPILTTRGCPYNCTFCGARNINGRKVRARSVRSLIEEIEYLHNDFGVDAVNIIDDNFTFHLDFAKTVCRGLIAKGLDKLSYNCPNGVRMERLDDELLHLMKSAGWQWIFIAPESGSPATLAKMKKQITPTMVVETVKKIHRAGLNVFGFFIIGYPGESIRDVLMTLRFACRAGFDSVVFTCFHPLPGTPIYEEMRRNGEVQAMDPSSTYYNINYAPEGMSPRQLKWLRLLGLIGFHLSSPRRIFLAFQYHSISSMFTFFKLLLPKVCREKP